MSTFFVTNEYLTPNSGGGILREFWRENKFVKYGDFVSLAEAKECALKNNGVITEIDMEAKNAPVILYHPEECIFKRRKLTMLLMRKFNGIFFINLSERTDRLERIQARLHEVGIYAQRFEGIKVSKDRVPPDWTAATNCYGCALSHLSIYDKSLKTEIEKPVLIFEDDAVFCDDFINNFEDCLCDLPPDWQIFYLGCNNLEPPSPITDKIAKVRKAYTTHAYAIKPEAMRQVLNHPRSYKDAPDVVLSYLQELLPTYCCTPSLVTQEAGYSDILERYDDYSTVIR